MSSIYTINKQKHDHLDVCDENMLLRWTYSKLILLIVISGKYIQPNSYKYFNIYIKVTNQTKRLTLR
jgi:hypothetical protein